MSIKRQIIRNYYRHSFTQGLHGKPNKCLHRFWEIQRHNNRRRKQVVSGE